MDFVKKSALKEITYYVRKINKRKYEKNSSKEFMYMLYFYPRAFSSIMVMLISRFPKFVYWQNQHHLQFCFDLIGLLCL